MQISVSHTTRYRFDIAPAHGLQRLRLKPKSSHGQNVLDWTMTVEGAQVQTSYDDHNNNQTALVLFSADTREIVVTCTGVVETADNAGIIGPHTGSMPLWAFLGQTDLTRPGARLRELAGRFRDSSAVPLDRLHRLSAAVHAAVAFKTGETDATTTAEMALAAGHGVCQDHSHVFIAAARLLGIPARYVSGYLLMDEVVEQQAGHGWAEAHVDELGWVGFDVANGVCPDERYVRVATGFDYRDAAPVTGISQGAGGSELSVRLSVDQQTGARPQARAAQ
ncbi:MAG: transglutaminase family protein [Pseudomonadota bacterium]|nr:transglutaminase family protein [Pseudomonadota bacterium]